MNEMFEKYLAAIELFEKSFIHLIVIIIGSQFFSYTFSYDKKKDTNMHYKTLNETTNKNK